MGFISGKVSVGVEKFGSSDQILPIEDTSTSVIMIGKIALDFLFAMAAGFG